MSELELEGFVADFALGMEKADARRPQQVSSRTGKAYQPGLGPHTEAKTVDLVMLELEATKPDVYLGYSTGVPYPGLSPVKRCDLVVGTWAVEAKMLRIMGDNGKPNDNMLMHILSPYPQHRSALTDCRKLGESSLGPRKAILIFGYEYEVWPMEPTITAFETLAAREVSLGNRRSASVERLVHPVHQQGAVFGWEILGVSD